MNSLAARMRSSSVTSRHLLLLASMSVGASIASPAAAQATYNFSYTYGDSQVETGSLTGTLQGDGNHFTVTGGTLSYNGGSSQSFVSLYSLDYYAGYGSGYNGDGTPVVTLDGSYMDFYESDSNSNQSYFGHNDTYSGSSGVAAADAISDYEPFNPAAFSAALVAPAPEPSSWALMILGFGIAGTVLQRRQPVAVRIAYA